MITLKFTKIKNIILSINILFSSTLATLSTGINSSNINCQSNINSLKTIGYIQIDEKIKCELIESFNGETIKLGHEIFKNFFDIIFFLLMDKIIENDHHFFKENPTLSKVALHGSNFYTGLLEIFYKMLMEEKSEVTVDHFLVEFITYLETKDDFENFVSYLKTANQQYYSFFGHMH